jgi:hypothetical protein
MTPAPSARAPAGPDAPIEVVLPRGGAPRRPRFRRPAAPPPGGGVADRIARTLWGSYLACAALVGLVGLYDLHHQPSAPRQAAVAAMYAFYQLTGYALMRALDKAPR